MIITDLVQIQKLAEKKSDENWEYRAFLKESALPSKRIDAVVHRLNEKISAQIDCTACANCCKTILPILDQEDVDNFARGLGLPVETFTKEYLIEAETGLTFKGTPCPFLTDNKCSNYEHRPKDCASYPHLHKPGFVRRTIGVMSSCSTCPIVFNVIEALKVELPQD
jgi:Fe-S-cluster containining protein